MNENFYKKSGIVISKLARDLIISTPGTRLPSLVDYAQTLSVSRGVIQQGLAYLEECKSIKLKKSHGTGTILQSVDMSKLRENTGWDIITINMPVPGTTSLASLTSSLYQLNSVFPIPVAMVYVTGSENRIYYLKKNIYDAIVVSAASAKSYCAKYDFLDTPIFLDNCQYAGEFCSYFANPRNTTVKDGMRVPYDPSSKDHYEVTKAMCSGKKVEWIETPFIQLSEALKNGKVDVVFHRREFPMLQFEHLNPIPVKLEGFSTYDMTTPVILFHKENYGMRNLFTHYLSVSKIQDHQQKVLRGELEPRFF